MLFCDGCDLATYHMACLLPPIETVPEDDWLCPVCEQVICILIQKLFPTLFPLSNRKYDIIHDF